jgi:hypothetical protein
LTTKDTTYRVIQRRAGKPWQGEAPAEPDDPADRQRFGSAGASPSQRGQHPWQGNRSCAQDFALIQFSVFSFQFSVVSCQLSVVSGQWAVVRGGPCTVEWGGATRSFFCHGRTRNVTEERKGLGGVISQPRMTRMTRMGWMVQAC